MSADRIFMPPAPLSTFLGIFFIFLAGICWFSVRRSWKGAVKEGSNFKSGILNAIVGGVSIALATKILGTTVLGVFLFCMGLMFFSTGRRLPFGRARSGSEWALDVTNAITGGILIAIAVKALHF